MNNDELKKKIADIIYHTGCTGACCECDYSKHSDADTYCKAMLKASALISAGIGDVSELKKHRILVKSVSIPNDENFYIVPQTEIDIKQLYNGEEVEQIVKERDQYKCRARAAELVAKTAGETGFLKYEEMKHRAEVAERALDLCETAYILALNGREHEGISQQAIVSDLGVHGFFMEQAEKELSEERE